MIDVRQTDTFTAWIDKLRDRTARSVILRRIDRAKDGNLGDVRPIGAGLSELRVDYGPGYRVYLKTLHSGAIVVLLCGGDKGSQARDIERAVKLAKGIKS